MKVPTIKRTVAALGLALACIASTPTDSSAQSRGTWIGGELGDPAGIVIRPSYDRGTAYEWLAAWDLDKFFFLNVHRLSETHLNPENTLHFFFGPGLFVGVEDSPEDEAIAGISGRLGLGFGKERYRVYLAVTPRLSVIPATESQIGGSLGIQFKL